MKAIIAKKFGGPEELCIVDVPPPEPKPDHVLISVKAFGINRAETYMRRGKWGDSAAIGGIECVGIVEACPGAEFPRGTKVAAVMGGMGRTIDGSYAEFTNPPASNVVAIKTDLPWEHLAALPLSYASAWTCLMGSLALKKGQMLLVRGGTSAFGQAAINIAADLGAKVIATSRQKERLPHLEKLGAERGELERPALASTLPEARHVDAVLDLLGEQTALDSLELLKPGGRACLAGFLGGIESSSNANFLDEMPTGVFLTLFGSSAFGTPSCPLTSIPFQAIADKAASGAYNAKPVLVLPFERIREAKETMEANQANGKIVMVV
jgi:NADPH:quinone reductase-like Zn-dependent oxidoreductase